MNFHGTMGGINLETGKNKQTRKDNFSPELVPLMVCHVAIPDLCWHHWVNNTGMQGKCSSNCILRKARLLSVDCYGPPSNGKHLSAGSVVSTVQPIQHTEPSDIQAKSRTWAAVRFPRSYLFSRLNRPRSHSLPSQGKFSSSSHPWRTSRFPNWYFICWSKLSLKNLHSQDSQDSRTTIK